jgi:hypothetical protein
MLTILYCLAHWVGLLWYALSAYEGFRCTNDLVDLMTPYCAARSTVDLVGARGRKRQTQRCLRSLPLCGLDVHS